MAGESDDDCAGCRLGLRDHECDNAIGTLPDACRNLLPHAIDWRDTVYSSNVDRRGVVHGEENRRELAALDRFINACRHFGLDR